MATGITFRIVSAGIADLADVMTAMGDAFDPEYGEAWTEAQCAGVLGMPGSWLLIARSCDEPAGFALLRTILGEAELLLIAVRTRFRRQGIGAALLHQAIANARGEGVVAVHLEVRDGNPALHLYRSTGFDQVGLRHGYYRGRSGRVFDALTFKRTLSID